MPMKNHAVKSIVMVLMGIVGGCTLLPAQSTVKEPFGVGTHWNEADTFNVIKDAGIQWIRMDFSWYHVQPESPDAWTFENIDRAVENAHQLGLKILAILSYTPKWAATCPPDTKNYRIYAHREDCDGAYQNYLKTVVERYKDKVAAWEICNEIDHFGFLAIAPGCWVENHHPQESDVNKRRLQYLHMAELALQTLKPLNVTITTSGFAMGGTHDEGAVEWMVRQRPDLFKQFDIFNVHAYGWPKHTSLVTRIEEIKRIQAQAGLNLPVWMTEHGINVRPETIDDMDDAKAFFIKSFALGLGRGIDKFFWYRHQAGGGGHLTILDKKKQKTVIFDAYKLLTTQWNQPITFEPLNMPCLDGTIATLADGKKVAILWNIVLDVPFSVDAIADKIISACDMNGNSIDLGQWQTITDRPIFVQLK